MINILLNVLHFKHTLNTRLSIETKGYIDYFTTIFGRFEAFEHFGKVQPDLHLDYSRVLRVPIELDVVNFDCKVFHLYLQIV